MKRVISLIAFCVLLSQMRALADPTQLNFVMPAGVDPPTPYFFSFNGDFNLIPGSVLLGGATNGAELLVPSTDPFLVGEFTVQSLDPSLSGPFLVDCSASSPAGFTPWTASPDPSHPNDTVIIDRTSGGAATGQPYPGGKMFALLYVDPAFVSSAPPGFADATFRVTAFSVPEPGVAPYLAGAAVAGFGLWRRRRRT